MTAEVRIGLLKKWVREACLIARGDTDPVERNRFYALSLLLDALLFTTSPSPYQVKVAFEMFERILSGETFTKPGLIRSELITLKFSLNPSGTSEPLRREP